jgi:hypothetical protein
VTVSREEAIVEAIRELLLASGCVDHRVHRDRGNSFAQADLPAIDLRLQRAPSEDIGISVTRHDLEVRVDIFAAEQIGVAPSTVADAVMVAAHRALFADRTLGGLCRRLVLTRRDWRYSESGDGVQLQLEQVYTAVHATQANDLAISA